MGLLAIAKPRGLTSFQAVARIRRRLPDGVAVGHAGTLDPDAAGLLVVAVGEATGWLPWLQLTPKRYRFALRLGRATHTGDQAGRLVGRSGPPWPAAGEVADACRWMVGRGWQLPPQVSALKDQGRRGYRAVLQGKAVWPRPRRAEVRALRVLAGRGAHWELEAEVGSGVYVRGLARDVAECLGHAGSLAELERTAVGPFDLSGAVALEAAAQGPLVLRGVEGVLAIPACPVSAPVAAALRVGRAPERIPGLRLPPDAGPLALTAGGLLLAVVERTPDGRVAYRRVFPAACGQTAAEGESPQGGQRR